MPPATLRITEVISHTVGGFGCPRENFIPDTVLLYQTLPALSSPAVFPELLLIQRQNILEGLLMGKVPLGSVRQVHDLLGAAP